MSQSRQAVGRKTFRSLFVICFAFMLFGLASKGAADATGPVTNLPLPRFVSLKATEGNIRRGPSLSHRIDWVLKKPGMPLKVTAEHGHWRRVEDHEGVGGWIHYTLLSGTRTVLVQQELLSLRTRPAVDAPIVAAMQIGYIARLGECELEWCRLSAEGYRGWAPKSRLWGVGIDEIRE